MLCMETILKIRRLYHKDGLSQRKIAEKLHLSRRTVRKYLNIVEIPEYQRQYTDSPKLGPYKERLVERLKEEMDKPPSQRLTAVRHFEYLQSLGFEGKYPCVSRFINRYKATFSPSTSAVFIPQKFPLGESYQFDWSIEKVVLNGIETTVNIAHFRLCHSRAYYVRAYFRQTLEMLMDAHNHAFAYFGGVPSRGIYDNPKTIVKQIKSGKERSFNEGFLTMMNHFLIEPVACTPASGWEKGQVERQVQTLRKRLFRPLLAFSSLEELNNYLRDWCARRIQTQPWVEDKQQTVSQRLEKEREKLSPFKPYLGYRTTRLLVNTSALILFDAHRYSVPCHLCGKEVIAQIGAQEIVLVYQHQIVARHPRQFTKGGTSYNPLHYLSALKRKPGALRHGEPFQGWALPAAIQTLQHHLLKQPRGDKAMVKLLSLIADFGEDIGVTAAELALEQGLPTVEAVLNIILRLTEPTVPKIESRHVALSCPPKANLSQFDQLLQYRRTTTFPSLK